MPSAASWVVNALVDATPISGPARVSITQLRLAHQRALGHVADRELREVARLLGEAAAPPACRRSRRTARRSRTACSSAPPGCGSGTRSRSPPSTAARQICSMKYLATRPAWKLVPQATMRTASVFANTAWRRRAERGLEQLAAGHALLERLRHGARLLVDFLEHVVRELALLGGVGRELARPCTLRCTALPSRSSIAHAVAADLGHVAFLEEDERARHRQQRRHVGGDEVLAARRGRSPPGSRGARTTMRSGSSCDITASA